MLIRNGIDVCSIGVPSGLVMACTRPMPGMWKMLLAIRSITSMSAGLRTSWSVSTSSSSGFIRACGKCRSAAAYPTLAGMSAAGTRGRCSSACTTAGQAGRPGRAPSSPRESVRANARRPCRPGASRASCIFRLGSNKPKRLPMVSSAGAMVKRRRHRDEHADRQRNTEGLEVRQPGEVQAERRAGDCQPRAEDDVGGAVIHGVEGGFAILAGLTRLVVAADEEDRVVRARGDRQRGEQVDRECRQPDEVVIAEGRDDSPGRRQLDEHHHQHEQHGDDRAVDEQQHQEDHADGDRGDQPDALVAGVVLIVRQRRGTGDIGLDARRWRRTARRCRGPLATDSLARLSPWLPAR